jgi:post-segregation antitoxin (ccd killing protein)|tara:strand:- start:4715 stop:4927 length:213 start_codon:yes stop_codon:yes gene_type:complete
MLYCAKTYKGFKLLVCRGEMVKDYLYGGKLNVYLGMKLKDEFRELAKSKNMTMSALTVFLINKELKRKHE